MKRCALLSSLWKIWAAAILFQQTKSYWGMKIWKFTLRRSSGVNNTLRKSWSLQSFSRKISDKMKPCNSNLGIANAEAPKTTSTSSPSMCISLPASSSVSPWSPTTSYSRTSHWFPDSPWPHLHEIFFRGTWTLIEKAKWVLAEPTTDTASAWGEVISSCRITLFSDIPWNSNTWLSICRFTYLNH